MYATARRRQVPQNIPNVSSTLIEESTTTKMADDGHDELVDYDEDEVRYCRWLIGKQERCAPICVDRIDIGHGHWIFAPDWSVPHQL